MTLEEMRDLSRKLASELFSTKDLPCTQTARCLQAEEGRKLTREEMKRGWTRRPFNAYDPEKMCNNCRAYWFAEMLAQSLHDIYCWQVRIAASEQIKGK